MYDALLVRHCAPTLAGLKTGSLFSCSFNQTETMFACLRRWNRLFTDFGIRTLPLSRVRQRTLIYTYRPSALRIDLAAPQAAQLLTELDYPHACPERSVAHLINRLRLSRTFPHEIGLFLGYPPEDVCGFMQDPAACKLSGCWKVYGNVRAAQIRFDSFRSCTQSCCALLTHGVPLEQLLAPFKILTTS